VTQKSWLKAGTILAAALTTLLALPTAAHADTAMTFRNQMTGEYLSIDPSFTDYASTYPILYGTWTGWSVHLWNDGTRRLQNQATGRCLSNTGYLAPCDDSQSQSWWFKYWGDGTVRLQNQATGWCLSSPGPDQLSAGPCDTSMQQSWYY
jgi:hypothetical protein